MNKLRNLFAEFGYTQHEIEKKILDTWQIFFFGLPEERLYYCDDKKNGYILDTGNHDIRSEGMSYGMMLSVQMNEKEIFDSIWRWSKTHMYMNNGDQAGFFAWSCAPDGKQNYHGAAPDGEEYFALALFFASSRWGDSSGIFNYSNEARKLLHSCLHTTLPMWNSENYYIRFAPDSNFTDPSYHLPHFYAQFSNRAYVQDTTFWRKAEKASRSFLNSTCHPKTGMAPEYSFNDGKPNNDGPPDGHGFFYSDSYRVGANIGLDALWYGHNNETEKIAKHLQQFFVNKKPCEYMIYQIDGTPINRPALHPTGLLSTLAQASIAINLNDTQAAKNVEYFIRLFWNTPLRTGEHRYYDNCLYFFALLALSGKYRIF